MIVAGDCLAGGGGVTHAMTKIDNMKVIWVLNHDQMAIRTNMFNNKGIKHYWSNLYTQDEHEMEPVDFFWASIECTTHSKANGGKNKKTGSYMLGWELVRYIKYMMPWVIGIENVTEFKNWSPLKNNGQPDIKKKGQEFEKWEKAICGLGYEYHEQILNAADYGIPTRRIRYFAFFTRIELGMQINWPKQTHSKEGNNGFKKWVACKSYINLINEGNSIFGREFNPNIKKGKRKKLSPNTLRRIAGGIKKYAPELYFIFQYYSSGTWLQSIDDPLRSITTKDRHVLVTLEKKEFVNNYCKVDKRQFITDGTFSDISKISSIDESLNTITAQQRHQLITAKSQFISKQYNSNGNPEANNQSLEDPCGSLTSQEKIQFITAYFNSSGNPGSQNQSLDSPLGTILTGTNKKALITAIENGDFDFDIKMRFLDPEELSQITTFPEKYFTNPLLRLTKKDQVKLIGNAVPPEWAKMIIEPVIKELDEILSRKRQAI